jgi:hypothetical protein
MDLNVDSLGTDYCEKLNKMVSSKKNILMITDSKLIDSTPI